MPPGPVVGVAVFSAFASATNLAIRNDPTIEPWQYLNGGSFSGPPQPLSPDPLVAYRWGPAVNSTPLQVRLFPGQLSER